MGDGLPRLKSGKCNDCHVFHEVNTIKSEYPKERATHEHEISARYFCGRCRVLHQSGIPPDTAALVERYGSLPYPQLVKALQQSEPTRSSPPVRGQAPRGSPIQRRVARDKAHPGMSRDDLRKVLTLMSGDVRTCNLQAQPYQQADGSCALLVDDGLGHQRWVYALCDWQEDFASMRTTLDLFS